MTREVQGQARRDALYFRVVRWCPPPATMAEAQAEPAPAKPAEEAGTWQLPQVPQLQHPNEVRQSTIAARNPATALRANTSLPLATHRSPAVPAGLGEEASRGLDVAVGHGHILPGRG